MLDKKTSILLVDDDSLVANSLARMLRAKRYNVSICHDPARALAFCDKFQFDLIITDQRMPLMDGTEFARLARRKQPYTRVVLISGYSDTCKVEEACDSGVVHHYVSKPWDNTKLIEVIDEQLLIAELRDSFQQDFRAIAMVR